MRQAQAAIDRYEAKVDRSVGEKGCHRWLAFCNPGGYGMFWGGERHPSGQPKMVLAHRWGYEHFIGPIPPGDVVLHSCDTPGCQNPEHWVLGSQADNVADMVAKGRNRAIQGRRHYATRLTEDDVRAIRSRHAAGESMRALGRAFSINSGTVSYIVNRKSWKHVP